MKNSEIEILLDMAEAVVKAGDELNGINPELDSYERYSGVVSGYNSLSYQLATWASLIVSVIKELRAAKSELRKKAREARKAK